MKSAYNYTTYNPAFDDEPTAPLRPASSQRHRGRRRQRRPSTQRVAPVSPRRKHGLALSVKPGVVFAWGIIFLLVMTVTFLNAVALATAFRGRQLDNEISEVQNALHRDYSRIAVLTSPDQARRIAQVKGLQKVTPELIDDLTRDSTSRLAANPKDSRPQAPMTHLGGTNAVSQPNRQSRELVQFVLLQ